MGRGFNPVLKLAFWSPLVLEGYLAQTLLTPLMKPSLSERVSYCGGGKVREQKEGKENWERYVK